MNKRRNTILTVALLSVNIFLVLIYSMCMLKIENNNKIVNTPTYFEENRNYCENNIDIYDDICYEESVYTYSDTIEINTGINNIRA